MAKSSKSSRQGPEFQRGQLEDGGWLPGVQAGFAEKPQQRRSVQSAMQILAAAEAVLGTVGSRGLTMQAVAAQANVSVGGIYGRFDGKDGLLIAVKDMVLSRMEADMEQRLPACSNLYGVVREFVDCLSTHLSRPAVVAATYDPEQPEPAAQRGMLARQRMLQVFGDAVRRHATNIGHEDLDTAVLTVQNIVLGTILFTAPRPGGTDFPDGRQKIELTRACFLYLSSPASTAGAKG